MIDDKRLYAELFAGLPQVSACVGWLRSQDEPNCSYHLKDGVVVRVVWPAPPTQAQIDQADAIIQAHDGRPRRPRLPEDIVDALNALTGPQKTAVWNDITAGGAAAKWKTHRGPHASLICTQHLLATSTTASAAEVLQAKVHGVAYYCLDVPGYLVHPAFDLTINVPGDEVI